LQHAFTVDVEDWYHGIPVSAETRASAERRLERGLDLLLEILAGASVRGTFFVLGPVAREHPAAVRRIAAAGHEIGCHGWSHDPLYTLSREVMRDETVRARDAIQEVTGRRVDAYRAAYFSVTKASLWALEVLAELGFRYDSSVFPVRNWRYGIVGFDPNPQLMDTAGGPIFEVPMSVRRVLGRDIPVSGGAYFRIYPYAITHANFESAERAGRPVVFYLHPWELDPGHPRVPFSWRPRATHYVNLAATAPRLRRLVHDFSFAPLEEVFSNELERARP